MRAFHSCLALVLFGTSASTATATAVRARIINANIHNGNGKKAKTNANINGRSLQQQQQADEPSPSSSSSSFVLADKVAALSPSDKHRLEQLLASGGLETTSNNSDNDNQHNQLSQGRRKTMKAEQSDTDLYIGNNADSDNNDDDDNDEEQVFKPEDVTADPRELPLPTTEAGSGNNNGEDDTNENDAGVNADSGTNGNNNDDGRGTDASDDWQMNTRFDDGTTDGTADETTTSGNDGGIDNNAAEEAETDGAGTGGSIFDNGDGNGNDNGGENSETGNNGDDANGSDATSTSPNTTTRGDNDDSNTNTKPTFPDDAAPRCQLDKSTGLFGSATDPESNSGLAKSTIVRYTYEVEFDLSKVERLMKALPKMENALGDALVPNMFEECAEEEANDVSDSQALDNGWVKPPPGVEISDERDRAKRSTDNDNNVQEDGLRRRMKQTAAAMKLIRRAKEVSGRIVCMLALFNSYLLSLSRQALINISIRYILWISPISPHFNLFPSIFCGALDRRRRRI